MGDSKTMTVPLLDLKAQYQSIRNPVREAIDEVCDSQWFVMGPNVKALEERIAGYSGCAHGIGVSSGTDALLVALMALDIGAGDAVITTPYSFFATAGVIARLGATPVFCDIDPVTYNLDPSAVSTIIEKYCDWDGKDLIHLPSGAKIRALMPVHLYGQTADLDAIMPIARMYGIPVVEDAAQSIGSEGPGGYRAGSVGDIGCFSFFPSKNLGAFGDGGMTTTNDPNVAERMKILRLHGGSPKYYHSVVGGNFRLDALQAAILLVKLKFLDDWTAGRQANAAFYDEKFASTVSGDVVQTPVTQTGTRHIYNQYVIRVKRRDELRQFLATAGISTEVYYPVPLHLQECFRYLGYRNGSCPVAEQAARETLALPVYPELNHDQMQYVVDQISLFFT